MITKKQAKEAAEDIIAELKRNPSIAKSDKTQLLMRLNKIKTFIAQQKEND